MADENDAERGFLSSDMLLKQSLAGLNMKSPHLSTMALKGDEKLVERFLTENVTAGVTEGGRGKGQLYIACFWGFYDVVKALLAEGADVNAQNMESQWTPLHAASFQEHGKIVMLLLESGARHDLTDLEGRSPADFASISDKIWPHFAALGIPRTSKQVLVEKGILKKPVSPDSSSTYNTSNSRPGSGTRVSSGGKSRPNSAFSLCKELSEGSQAFASPAAVNGDVLAGDSERSQRTSQVPVSEPSLGMWRK